MMRTRIFLSFFFLFFGALILLVPNAALARDCADWEVGVDPVLIFGQEYGDFRRGDQDYQFYIEDINQPVGWYTITASLLDVGDPLAPTLVWQKEDSFIIGGPATSFSYEGSYENLVLTSKVYDGYWIDELYIFDPEDEPNKVTLGVDSLSRLYFRDNVIWLHRLVSPHDIYSYDLQDWPNLTEIGSIVLPYNRDVYIDPNGAFYLDDDELHFLDLDDPANPQEGGFYRLHDSSFIRYAFDQDEKIIYIVDGNKLVTVDYSNFMNPHSVGSYTCPDEIWRIEVFGDEAIVFYAESFQVMSLLDPENIMPLSGVISEPNDRSYQCARSGDLLYIACGSFGVVLYDLADPANPLYLGRGTGSNRILNLVGDYLVGDGKVYLRDCLDVSPVHPQKGPKGVRLGEPVPNPFNPRTSIKFTLDRERVIDLRVYDLRGHRTCTLATGSWPTGDYDVVWNGTDDHGRQVPSGVYFFMLQTGEIRQISRAVLVR